MLLQGQQGASLQLTARLQTELADYKPTLAINNGDIAYARHAFQDAPVALQLFRNALLSVAAVLYGNI